MAIRSKEDIEARLKPLADRGRMIAVVEPLEEQRSEMVRAANRCGLITYAAPDFKTVLENQRIHESLGAMLMGSAILGQADVQSAREFSSFHGLPLVVTATVTGVRPTVVPPEPLFRFQEGRTAGDPARDIPDWATAALGLLAEMVGEE